MVTAAQRRFRAIFLTTATTALGLTPMLFETNTQAQFLIPMAVSLATGIVFASVVILFLVPSLIVIREDLRNLFRGQSQTLRRRLGFPGAAPQSGPPHRESEDAFSTPPRRARLTLGNAASSFL